MKQEVLSRDELRREVERTMTERQLMDRVTSMAKARGWLCYHTWQSRHSEAGFPDLVLVRTHRADMRVLYLELKRDKGRLTQAQQAWIDALRNAQQEVRVCYPSDLDTIEALLDGRIQGRARGGARGKTGDR